MRSLTWDHLLLHRLRKIPPCGKLTIAAKGGSLDLARKAGADNEVARDFAGRNLQFRHALGPAPRIRPNRARFQLDIASVVGASYGSPCTDVDWKREDRCPKAKFQAAVFQGQHKVTTPADDFTPIDQGRLDCD